MKTSLSQPELTRYERHFLVEGFDQTAQEKLKAARVLVIGVGGLGSAALNYLTAAGVGRIGIVEFDTVCLSNLQRQVLYTTRHLDRSKAETASQRLKALNPHTEIQTFGLRLNDENAEEIFRNFDLVVDCTDNYETRYVIDRTCGKLNIPMIYGTAQECGGQVSVFHYAGTKGYADLYPIEEVPETVPVGVLSPIPGLVGCIEATEAIKIITGYGETLAGKLLDIDGKTMSFHVFRL